MAMYVVIGVLIGLAIGLLLRWNPWTSHGTLHVDHSNPKKALCFLEIDNEDVLGKKQLILKVDHKANFSQE